MTKNLTYRQRCNESHIGLQTAHDLIVRILESKKFPLSIDHLVTPHYIHKEKRRYMTSGVIKYKKRDLDG